MKSLAIAIPIFLLSSLTHAREPRVSVNATALGKIIGAYCQNLVEGVLSRSNVPPEKKEELGKAAFEECVQYMIVGLQPTKLTEL